jgi:hypothetical protein
MPKNPQNPRNAPLSPSRGPITQRKEGAAGHRNAASPAEVARYIAEFSAELSSLARESNLDLLAYLLDMARLEAAQLARSEGSAG